ncbi:MAG TPA: glycosyltransferase family 39 protein [Vicinamibacterales bacterium]|nr:glycosyltransferase family 39 protein [Vicinamibacterales bacterium]
MSVGPINHESVRRSLLVGLVFLVAMLALQWSVGAQRGEQGIYSDDAAHFMNGLLVRDYLTEALGRNPVSFAEEYYHSYPKIAPGMWPPLFHIMLGVFLLPHWPPHAAALFLLALLSAWAAWRLYRIVSLFSTRVMGVAAGLLFLSTPVVVSLTTSIMLDAVLATFAIEAAYWLAVYTRTDQWRHAALFGLFTAMACLTKGNGISVVFAPAAMILLTGRYKMLRRPGLYLSAAIVVALAVPALVVTYRLDAAIGDFGPVTAGTVLSRLAYYCGYLWRQLGPAATTFAVIGVLYAIARGRRWQEDAPLPLAQAMTALVAGAFVFHLFNPHQLASGRYMTLAIAPLFVLIAVGVQVASRFVAGPARRHAVHAALLGLLVVTTFFARPALAVRKPFGYHDVVNHLNSRDSVAGKRMLIVSNEAGEGALVTDVAIRRLRPRPTIVRGSKLLATDNWNGYNFNLRFGTAQSIIQELEDLHVDYLLLDSSPEALRLPYWGLIKELVESHEDRLQMEYYNTVDTRNGPTRPLALYRLKYHSPGPPKPLEIQLSRSVQQLLKR